jgi:hypothetical protein
MEAFGAGGPARCCSLGPRGLLASPRRFNSQDSQDLQCDFSEVRENAGQGKSGQVKPERRSRVQWDLHDYLRLFTLIYAFLRLSGKK